MPVRVSVISPSAKALSTGHRGWRYRLILTGLSDFGGGMWVE